MFNSYLSFLSSSAVDASIYRYVQEYRERISFFIRRAKKAARKARAVGPRVVRVVDLEVEDQFPNQRYYTSSKILLLLTKYRKSTKKKFFGASSLSTFHYFPSIYEIRSFAGNS